jgi:hypothetical protein
MAKSADLKNGNIWRMLMEARVDVKNYAKNVIKDEKLLTDLLEGILSKKDEIRFNSYKILLRISEVYPKVLYPKWELLAVLLDSNNHYHRFIAINLLANLASVDIKNKFDEIFDRFFSNIDCDKTMVAGQAALNSGKIARAKPNLQKKITYKLLNIDKMHRGKHKDLMKAYAIEAFGEYFEVSADKEKILDFVKEQFDSKSPKTRKLAREFLKERKI